MSESERASERERGGEVESVASYHICADVSAVVIPIR